MRRREKVDDRNFNDDQNDTGRCRVSNSMARFSMASEMVVWVCLDKPATIKKLEVVMTRGKGVSKWGGIRDVIGGTWAGNRDFLLESFGRVLFVIKVEREIYVDDYF